MHDLSPCTHLLDVPTRLRADWGRAHVDIFQALEDARVAGDSVGTERMYVPWYAQMVPLLARCASTLLRGPMRGTRHRGKQTNIIADRFRLWREDRRDRLVELWQSDRARSLRYRQGRGVSSQVQRRIQSAG